MHSGTRYAKLIQFYKSVLSVFSFVQQQQSMRRQGALAFSMFGVLLAHGDLRNNKLNQLAVNLWNLSHKHGYCETRVSVSLHATGFSCSSARISFNLYLFFLLLLFKYAFCECIHGSPLLVSATGSDSGVHQTSGSAARHGVPVGYSPKALAAVPHLNTCLTLCKIPLRKNAPVKCVNK